MKESRMAHKRGNGDFPSGFRGMFRLPRGPLNPEVGEKLEEIAADHGGLNFHRFGT